MGIDYTKRPAAPPAGAAAAPAPAGQPGAPVSLSKVTLTKAAPTVSLTKHGGATGTLRVNLNWNARPQSHGLFKRTVQLDLDLGCLFEFGDGTKGVVQALGNAFRGFDSTGKELVRLDGDDRSGASTEGENLYIDLRDPARIRRILVFALIYEGAANWAEAQGIATLLPVGAPPVEIHLDEPRDGARICAIAMLENRGGDVVVNRLINYIDGAQRALDQAYGWGMNWTPGRK
jgi:tellurite resistance protein TerA